jgi:hypothetical protein
MKVPLTEQDVVPAPDLNLGSVLRVEQHPIFWLDRSDMCSHRNDLAPGEPAPDSDCRRDQDPTATASFPGLVVGRYQHPIVQHADRQPTFVKTGRVLAVAWVDHHSVALPTSHDGADDQQEANDTRDCGSHNCDSTDTEIATSGEDFGLGIFQFGICETLHIIDLALLDPVGMDLVDQRFDRGDQPIPSGAQIGLDLRWGTGGLSGGLRRGLRSVVGHVPSLA